MPGKLID